MLRKSSKFLEFACLKKGKLSLKFVITDRRHQVKKCNYLSHCNNRFPPSAYLHRCVYILSNILCSHFNSVSLSFALSKKHRHMHPQPHIIYVCQKIKYFLFHSFVTIFLGFNVTSLSDRNFPQISFRYYLGIAMTSWER